MNILYSVTFFGLYDPILTSIPVTTTKEFGFWIQSATLHIYRQKLRINNQTNSFMTTAILLARTHTHPVNDSIDAK